MDPALENSPLGRYKRLYEEQNGDIEILLADNKRRRVHSQFLSAATGYFGTVLAKDLIEKSSHQISLPDIDEDVADMIFIYIYCGERLAIIGDETSWDLGVRVASASDRFLLSQYRDFLLNCFLEIPKNKMMVMLNHLGNYYIPTFDKHIDQLIEKIKTYIMTYDASANCYDKNKDSDPNKYCCKHPNISTYYTGYGSWKNKVVQCTAEKHDPHCCSSSNRILDIPGDLCLPTDIANKLFIAIASK
jgi:hypothetical protein